MKTSDLDILIVPGWSGSQPDHWQSRWARQLKTARVIKQDDMLEPDKDAWVARIINTIDTCERPVLLVAHSLGCIAVAHAGALLTGKNVKGAILVAPADINDAKNWPLTNGHQFSKSGDTFKPIPSAPLPFPSTLIASTNDPYCSQPRAQELALDWGSHFIDAGKSGHINVSSGHGPWPDGLMRLGVFLKNLG